MLRAQSPEREAEARIRQQWRAAGSPGFKPQAQQMSWEQLNQLPAATARDASGNIGAGLSGTPEYQNWLRTANQNAAAESQAFNAWRQSQPGHAQPVQQPSQGTPYGNGSNAAQNDAQWGAGNWAYSRAPQAAPPQAGSQRPAQAQPQGTPYGSYQPMPSQTAQQNGPSVMGWPDTTGQQFGRRDGYTHSLYGSQSKSPSAVPYSAYRPSQAQPVQQQSQGTQYGQRPAAPEGDGSRYRGYQNDMRALNTWGRGGDPNQNYWQPGGAAPSQSQGGYGPSYGFTMPGMSFGGSQPFQSNAGNAANNPFNRPPPFSSQMTDGYGNPTNIQQFYGQQQDMIGNLLQRLGQQNQGTYLGQGNPPPSFFAPPQFDVQGMWNQAGQQGRFMAPPGFQGAAPSDTPNLVNPWFNSQRNQAALAAGRPGWL